MKACCSFFFGRKIIEVEDAESSKSAKNRIWVGSNFIGFPRLGAVGQYSNLTLGAFRGVGVPWGTGPLRQAGQAWTEAGAGPILPSIVGYSDAFPYGRPFRAAILRDARILGRFLCALDAGALPARGHRSREGGSSWCGRTCSLGETHVQFLRKCESALARAVNEAQAGRAGWDWSWSPGRRFEYAWRRLITLRVT